MADLLHGSNRWGAPVSGLTGPNNCAREWGFDGGGGPTRRQTRWESHGTMWTLQAVWLDAVGRHT